MEQIKRRASSISLSKKPEDLAEIRTKELAAVQDATKARPEGAIPDESTYIIDNAWLDQWKAFIGGGERPGPITNGRLLKDDGSPKEGLLQARDYRGLNEREWNIFYRTYGGGPWIVRNKVDIYGDTAKPNSIGLRARQSLSSTSLAISSSAGKVKDAASARLGMAGEISHALETLRAINKDPLLLQTKSKENREGKDGQPESAIPPKLVRGAQGFAFFTELKAGFLFSGRGGTGVVIARTENGKWSGPSLLGCGGVGAGFMIGMSRTDTMVVLNTKKAIDVFAGKGQFKFGGDLEVAAGPVGRNAGGSVRGGDGGVAPCYSYAISKGLYAGIQIDGTVVMTRHNDNAKFYGREVTPKEILEGQVEVPHLENQTELLELYALLDRLVQGDQLSDGLARAEHDRVGGMEKGPL